MSTGRAVWWSVGVVAATVLLLWLLGRPFICTCGTVSLWHGDINTAEDSQQLFDWYSFSHVLHGFLFYWLLWLLGRRMDVLRPVRRRFVLALAAECIWEVIENTPFIINRYREATIALGYMGDSIINSTMDIGCMMIGFLLAWRLPVWVTVLLALASEVIMAIAIRDNLTLNIVMLLWPIDAVRTWQGG
ncbi:MAG: DUF2585 family protein [Phycisphaerales bacterium]|jgi:hypothetical protein|nr:DUF2585 family protein [Phycisphaerales bacterium]